MNPWIAKAVILAATLTMIVIRSPHGQRSRSIKVVSSHSGALESVLMVLSGLGFFVPLIWVASPAFSFAEYPLHAAPLAAGILCFVAGLWLFYRSHADPRSQLVAHARGSRPASPRHARRVSTNSPPDVPRHC